MLSSNCALGDPLQVSSTQLDVVVVGSGPNGLAAAALLARAGLGVLVVEAADSIGGGTRTESLTLPGFQHDVCSAVHPLGVASPCFRELELERYGLSWIHPSAPLAHVLADGTAVTLERSLSETAIRLGADGPAYHALLEPFVRRFDLFVDSVLAPLRWPTAPGMLARFAWDAMLPMEKLAARHFKGQPAAALLAGIAAHATLPLDAWVTGSFALVLAAAGHGRGWPIARGGSRAIADALAASLAAHGGRIQTGWHVRTLRELPKARAYVLDVAPRYVAQIAEDRLPARFRRRLGRFRHGPGACKVDWALRGPIPWRDSECARAATVHLAGDLNTIAEVEAQVHDGKYPRRPFTLLGQPSAWDPSRTPSGMHAAWAYCHVPKGSPVDVSNAIEEQVERYAPGFRDLILARHVLTARELEKHNPNCIGGDVSGGVPDLAQLFFRPLARVDPYSTPAPDVFVCSSSTPPGGGVHGMCGWWAARSVLTRVFGRTLSP